MTGKHEKDPHKEDREKLHEELRALPTYQPVTPYTKATEKPAPVAEDPKQ